MIPPTIAGWGLEGGVGVCAFGDCAFGGVVVGVVPGGYVVKCTIGVFVFDTDGCVGFRAGEGFEFDDAIQQAREGDDAEMGGVGVVGEGF